MTQAPQKQLHHITPFKGFNSSGSQNLNLLMADSHIYLMDNHRAALWAWLQHIDLSKKYNLLHVDAHDDLSMSEVSHSKDEAEAIHSMNIEAYCEVPSKYESEDLGLEPLKMFRWDNYLAIFLTHFKQCVSEFYICTHELQPIPPPKQSLILKDSKRLS